MGGTQSSAPPSASGNNKKPSVVIGTNDVCSKIADIPKAIIPFKSYSADVSEYSETWALMSSGIFEFQDNKLILGRDQIAFLRILPGDSAEADRDGVTTTDILTSLVTDCVSDAFIPAFFSHQVCKGDVFTDMLEKCTNDGIGLMDTFSLDKPAWKDLSRDECGCLTMRMATRLYSGVPQVSIAVPSEYHASVAVGNAKAHAMIMKTVSGIDYESMKFTYTLLRGLPTNTDIEYVVSLETFLQTLAAKASAFSAKASIDERESAMAVIDVAFQVFYALTAMANAKLCHGRLQDGKRIIVIKHRIPRASVFVVDDCVYGLRTPYQVFITDFDKAFSEATEDELLLDMAAVAAVFANREGSARRIADCEMPLLVSTTSIKFVSTPRMGAGLCGFYNDNFGGGGCRTAATKCAPDGPLVSFFARAVSSKDTMSITEKASFDEAFSRYSVANAAFCTPAVVAERLYRELKIYYKGRVLTQEESKSILGTFDKRIVANSLHVPGAVRVNYTRAPRGGN